MSLKQWLKRKLPFTRKGLEDYLDERLREQQAELSALVNNLESDMIQRIVWQIGDVIETQIPWRLNDLQREFSAELKAQLHQMVNDPESGIIQRVRWQVGDAIETQIPWRLNDLQNDIAEVKQQKEEELLPQFRQELDIQLDQRFSSLRWMLYGLNRNGGTPPEYRILHRGKSSLNHKVSVILSLRDGNALMQSVASIREQTLHEIETILVDAGVENGSEEAAAACIEANPDMDIVYLRLETEGLSGARNAGLQEAMGEYISFLEEGDTLPPGACQAMYHTAQRMACDMVIGSCMRKEGETRWYEVPYLKQLCTRSEGQNLAGQYETAIYDPTIWNKLYRRKFLKDHKMCFFNDAFGMGMVFNLNALYSAKMVCTIDAVTYLRCTEAEA